MHRTLSSSAIHAYSIRELLSFAQDPTTVGVKLLQQVSDRLSVQLSACHQLHRQLLASHSDPNTSQKPSITNKGIRIRGHTPVWKDRPPNIRASALPKITQSMDRLLFLHRDTYDICRYTSQLTKPPNQSLLKTTLTQMRDRHARSVETLAEAVVAWRSMQPDSNEETDEQWDDRVLNDYLRGRFGVNLLCEHYLEIIKGKPNGTMAVDADLTFHISDAVSEARILTEAYYDTIPDVIVHSDSSICATFVEPWLHYALVEVLKNAVSATKDHAGNKDPPPIHISMDESDDHVWIHVQDSGGGLSTTCEQRVFAFCQTDKLWDRLDEQTTYAMVRSPVKGLGVGNRLSKLMLEHFGGDLLLTNTFEDATSATAGPVDAPRRGCRASVRLSKDLTLPENIPLCAFV